MQDGFAGEHFDAVVSCIASRTGTPSEAWSIDHKAHSNALTLAQRCRAQHFVLLSAICVQKPLRAFQQAKLAFEAERCNNVLPIGGPGSAFTPRDQGEALFALTGALFLLALAAHSVWPHAPDKPREALEVAYPGEYRQVLGQRTRFLDTDPRDAPALILLHGFGSSLDTW